MTCRALDAALCLLMAVLAFPVVALIGGPREAWRFVGDVWCEVRLWDREKG